MCETWTDFVNNCLYDAPGWLHWGASYWWMPLGLAVIFLVIAFCRFLHWLTYDEYPPHLRIGWMADGKKPSGFERLFSDYRIWTIVLAWVGWFGLVGLSAWYWWQPQHLLNILGADSVWELSPAGVPFVKGFLYTLWISSWLWVGISLLALFILWLDPYGFMKFYLIRGTAFIDPVQFEELPPKEQRFKHWKESEKKEIRQRSFYVKKDGGQFFLTKPETESGWIILSFNEESRALSGPGRRMNLSTGENLVWYQEGEGDIAVIKSDEDFCIGQNENALVRIQFKC